MKSQETISHTSVHASPHEQDKLQRVRKRERRYEIKEMLTEDDLYDARGLFERAHAELTPDKAFDFNAILAHAAVKLADAERMNYNGYIVHCDGKPVGFIIGSLSQYYSSFDQFCIMDVWYVDRKHRGSPAAFLLIKALIKWGALRGAVDHILSIIPDAHTPMQIRAFDNMARKLGFRQAGSTYVRNFNATRMDDRRY